MKPLWTLVCTGLVIVFATSVQAQDGGKRGFCVDYANEAVDLQRRNISLGCGIKGVRWHEWWDGHYGWCMDWVGPQEVRDHAELRRIEMSRCEGTDGGRHSRSYNDRR